MLMHEGSDSPRKPAAPPDRVFHHAPASRFRRPAASGKKSGLRRSLYFGPVLLLALLAFFSRYFYINAVSYIVGTTALGILVMILERTCLQGIPEGGGSGVCRIRPWQEPKKENEELRMQMRMLGTTDLRVSPVGLGCWQFSKGAGLMGRYWPELPDPVSRESFAGAWTEVSLV